MLDQVSLNAEPVPTVSQLAVLTFLSAVEGLLTAEGQVPGLRLTIHRVMSRAGQGYLQQVCAYVGPSDADWRNKVGRAFPVTHGIIGAAFRDGCIWRTKAYPDLAALKADLLTDAAANGENIDISRIATSYVAIPLLSPAGQAVLVFYSECQRLNFFANEQRLQQLRSMCNGLCRLLDWLQEDPLSSIRNFPLQRGIPVVSQETVYQTIQEQWHQSPPPKFDKVYSFNFEGLSGARHP